MANWASLHYLQEYFSHATGWAIGAAMLAANAKFRDGHKYQGMLGWINSWFMGLYFFWLMFNYGLPAAIVVHIVYDIVCFAWHAIIIFLTNRIRGRQVNYY